MKNICQDVFSPPILSVKGTVLATPHIVLLRLKSGRSHESLFSYETIVVTLLPRKHTAWWCCGSATT